MSRPVSCRYGGGCDLPDRKKRPSVLLALAVLLAALAPARLSAAPDLRGQVTAERKAQLRAEQLRPELRYVRTDVLARAYISAPLTIKNRQGEEFTIGIVDPGSAAVARRVSNVLSRSIDLARSGVGGHIPEPIVDRVQDDITSVKAVQKKWAGYGHRFVISRKSSRRPGETEVVGTILVTKDHETILFISAQYDDLVPVRDARGKLEHYRDQKGRAVTQRTLDETVASALLPLKDYKPDLFHQIENFAFIPEIRGGGLAREVLKAVSQLIGSDAADRAGRPLFPRGAAHGFWQIGEPPWQGRMRPMGFLADPSQHAYLLPTAATGPVAPTGTMRNRTFNRSWNVLEEYYLAMRLLLRGEGNASGRRLSPRLRRRFHELLATPSMRAVAERLQSRTDAAQMESEILRAGIKFPRRLPRLVLLATNGEAKLQYKYLLATFDDVLKSGKSK